MPVRLGAVLALCAIALRIMIPGGYMIAPSADQGGLPTIVICTGQGAMVVKTDADPKLEGLSKAAGKTGDEDGKAARDHGCVFAGFSAPLQAPSFQSMALPTFETFVPAALSLNHQRPGLGLAAPPPPKTGPPSII
jgi:hypothetical protein